MNDENMSNVEIAGVLRKMANSGYYDITEFEGMNVTEILKSASDLVVARYRGEITKNIEMEEKMKEVGENKAVDCKYHMPCGYCDRHGVACTVLI